MPRHKLKDGNKAEILVEIILMGAYRPTHGIPLRRGPWRTLKYLSAVNCKRHSEFKKMRS